MTTSEERLKILRMLEEDKITPDEAATLLRALDGGTRASSGTLAPGRENQYLRVQVTDLASGAPKVNVTIPIGLIHVGLRMAERFAPEEFGGMDMEELEALLSSGVVGKMIEVMDEEDQEMVEIYVE